MRDSKVRKNHARADAAGAFFVRCDSFASCLKNPFGLSRVPVIGFGRFWT